MKPTKDNNKEFDYEVDKIFGMLNDKKFSKAVMAVRWFNNPMTIDIRGVDISVDPVRPSKGISLSTDEAHKLVSILLDNGFGSTEDLEKALKKRRELYSIDIEDVINVGERITIE